MSLKINSKAFFSNYIFHPFEKELKNSEKLLAFTTSLFLAISTVGIFHMACYLKYPQTKFAIRAKTPTTENVKQVADKVGIIPENNPDQSRVEQFEISSNNQPNKIPKSDKILDEKETPTSDTKCDDVTNVSQSATKTFFASFDEYRLHQINNKHPVDIIVGRGRKNDKSCPILNTERPIFDIESPGTDKVSKYNPFTIDTSADVEPDLVASITILEDFKSMPNSCVDEIYLERLYPVFPQINFRTYYNAARLLKVGGLLIIDANSLCTTEMLPNLSKEFESILQAAGFPFMLYQENLSRSSYSDGEIFDDHKFAFVKYCELDDSMPRPLAKNEILSLEIKMENCHQKYKHKLS